MQNDHELAVTQQRIHQFQQLLLQLRQHERAENYALMATAYLLELDVTTQVHQTGDHALVHSR